MAELRLAPEGYEDNVRPRFSVVVPAYNEEAYLPNTLRSLLDQDFLGTYEVIVVDNNSTDATADVARELGVTVIGEVVPGVCAARQRGSSAARGEVIVSADADTTYPRDWLTRIEAKFEEDPRTIAVAGPCQYATDQRWIRRYASGLFALVDLVARRTGQVRYVSATNIAMTREAFPGYDVHQTQGGDELDLLRRLRPQGLVVWDATNVVTTSPRRLERGLVYNVFVNFLADYVVTYSVNRLSQRRRIGTARAFRPGADDAPRAAIAPKAARPRLH